MKALNLLIIALLLYSCDNASTQENTSPNNIIEKEDISIVNELETDNIINEEGKSIETRFNPPKGFERSNAEPQSFGYYLRNLPLKPHGTTVKTYDGYEKQNNDIYEAVVDMDVGDKDLQQCADAIMRLRAEYLFKQEEYNKIHFNFTNGFRVDYEKWRAGNRINVNGNKTNWVHKTSTDTSYSSFRNYMDWIFMYAGSLSLSRELKHIDKDNMQIGDIFIHGGSPGHAVIIVDMAINNETGEKLFMIAQSYMPAQDIQVLMNNQVDEISPWYSIYFDNTLYTPEWNFYQNELMRF